MKQEQRRDFSTILIILVALLLLPLLLGQSRYLISVLMNCAGVAVIASGVWLTFCIGRINICQAGFALIGAYVSAILIMKAGFNVWLALPLSCVVAALCGALIGSVILKLKGIYFSMLTICLTEAIRLAFLNGGELTQGAKGITGLPQAFATDSPLPLYYVGVALLALALAVVWRVHYSRLGGIFRAMRLNEDLAESFGVNVWRYRIMAFAIACGLGGLGGGYFALFTQSVYPQSFTVEHSIYYMLYCFLGGLDYVSGAMIGAFALTILFELLQDFQQYQSLIYGVLMIVVMLTLPNGLMALRGWSWSLPLHKDKGVVK
ncbi:branched-chain amino acid transport system permease protein [Herbaspirillum sp. Sphag1AN]|uniref:branched-chain amino acid ABC transporter permease n=1 Tax=unclassified Herbaspirillum TaxID=2624150 RepID=UPI0016107E72|nr:MULTISPECIES: branched-chain amino acid ABC transporter permease [unclassified Herbaspirillum]MBB3213844.1 branched-chain amino acid transport system permease protein [Herbaspirillum sp. Sphag1AN]MBB3247041.1 branched-chain amino acid transport system permease protein [Herbaspirillum sp. Sphag64]